MLPRGERRHSDTILRRAGQDKCCNFAGYRDAPVLQQVSAAWISLVDVADHLVIATSSQ